MTVPGIVIALFGILVLGAGIIGYLESTGIAHVIAGGGSGLGLVAGGLGVLKRKEFWLVFAPFLTLMTVLFFAHSFFISDQFTVSSLMAAIGTLALILFYGDLSSKENR